MEKWGWGGGGCLVGGPQTLGRERNGRTSDRTSKILQEKNGGLGGEEMQLQKGLKMEGTSGWYEKLATSNGRGENQDIIRTNNNCQGAEKSIDFKEGWGRPLNTNRDRESVRRKGREIWGKSRARQVDERKSCRV